MRKYSSKFIGISACLCSVAAILSSLPNHSQAAPLGGTTVSGVAAISASGSVTTINQSSDRAVIDWSSFNLATNETARFVVPSDQSATLNRITGGGVSTISGTVESNGVVYFSNPNGLVFDETSRVSANGFVATTGTISNFDFMNRGNFTNLGAAVVTLNGAVSAPAITAEAGTVTVGGNLSAGSGKILLSSTNLTTIGVSATISADAGLVGNGGKVIVWSDKHTDFLGAITARGGSNSGDGGFVEVSGKNTLNFSGRVSTLAPHGKTGTLLLDPATIEIGTGTTTGVSYISVTNLQNALNSNAVTIDANTPSTTGFTTAPTLTAGGSGSITVAADFAATTGTQNLTLTGAQIVIKANMTVLGTLTLTSTGTVWQDPSKVITAGTVTGSSVEGFALGGANLITNLGAITNTGGAGILVRNAKALAMAAVTLNGGTGGVAILNKGFDLTLSGTVTVRGSYLRLDLGANNLKGNQFITATGLDVYYTSGTSGNLGAISIGGGSFTFVNDKRITTTAISLSDSSTSSDWGTGFGSLTLSNAVAGVKTALGGGLTIETNAAATNSAINSQGVVYGGAVTIDGITSAGTNGPRNLRWIEGTAVGVLNNASTFASKLVLASSGGVITDSDNRSAAIVIGASLSSASTSDSSQSLTLLQYGAVTATGSHGTLVTNPVNFGGNIMLVQTGSVTGSGIYFLAGNGGSPLVTSGAGNIGLYQGAVAGGSGILLSGGSLTTGAAGSTLLLRQSAAAGGHGISVSATTLTTKGNLILSQSGSATGSAIITTGASLEAHSGTPNPTGTITITTSTTTVADDHGIKLDFDGAKVVVGQDLTVTQQGSAGLYGIWIKSVGDGSAVGRNLTVTQAGSAGSIVTGGGGILIESSKLIPNGTMSLLQTGTVGNSQPGIILEASGTFAGQGVELGSSTGGNGTVQTKNLGMVLKGASNFSIKNPKLRIDLGTGALTSINSDGSAPAAPGHYIGIYGKELIYSGAGSGNSAKIGMTGAGSILFLTDRSSTTSAVTLNATSQASHATLGWVAPTWTINQQTGDYTGTSGLTVGTSNQANSIPIFGVKFGGTVTLNGITTTSDAGKLGYIEAAGIGVLSNASRFNGILTLVSNGSGITSGTTTAGILIAVNLTTAGNLTLTQTGTVSSVATAVGIALNSTTVSVTGTLLVNQSGAAGASGIAISSSTLSTTGALTINQTSSSGSDGLKITGSILTAGGSLTLTQSGTATANGMVIQSSALTSGLGLSLIQSGGVGASSSGIVLEDTGGGTGNGVRFAAGDSTGNAQWLLLKTASKKLTLTVSGTGTDNFVATAGRVRLDLGTGGVLAAGSQTFKASGLEVFFSGAASGHTGTIAVGSGSFVFVNLLMTLNNTKNLTSSSTAAADWGTGLGAWTTGAIANTLTSYSAGGLTVTSAGAVTTVNGQGVAYNRQVTLDGITDGSAAAGLRYIESADRITVSSNANGSVFSGAVTLLSSSSGSGLVSFGGNLTVGGKLTIFGQKLTLSANATTTGGELFVYLGASGIYDNGTGAGYTLNTSNQSLTLTAASIKNTAATNAIFRLGSGTLTVGGGLTTSTSTPSAGGNYNSTYITDATKEVAFTAARVKYYFVSTAADVAAATTTIGATDSNFFVLPVSAITASDLGSKSDQSYSYQGTGLGADAEGDYLWRTSGTNDQSRTGATTFRLQDGHAVHFYNLTVTDTTTLNDDTPASWLSSSSSVTFHGTNQFDHGFVLASAGKIGQVAGSSLRLDGGNLVISSSGSVDLTEANNRLGNLGSLNSTGSIALSSNQVLTLAGNITTTGSGATISLKTTSGGITQTGVVTISGGDLSLNSAGAIRQTGSNRLIMNGGKLSITAATSIDLSSSENRLGTLGMITATGEIAITSGADLTLTDTISITGGGSDTISLSGLNVTLLNSITTSGGALTIRLPSGSGTYRQAAGVILNTSNQNLTITGAKNFDLTTGTVFEVGTGTFTPPPSSGTAFGPNLYFSNRPDMTQALMVKESQDDTAEYHPLSDLTRGLKISVFAPKNPAGEIHYSEADGLPDSTAKVTFWEVRQGSVTLVLTASEIRFGGRFNNFSSLQSDAPMTVLPGSILSGTITVGSGGLTLPSGASLGSGALRSHNNGVLKLTFTADFYQGSDGMQFDSGETGRLSLDSSGHNLSLLNRSNRFGSLAVKTGGGSFRITSEQALKFSSLSTELGWVWLESGGGISGVGTDWLSVGSVGFRAGGAVVLQGFFTNASGSGSSVSLSNSAVAALMGGIRSDSSVTVNGRGVTIFTGDIVGGSAVDIQTPVLAARDLTVASSGGSIEIAKSVATLTSEVGLRLDSGFGGRMTLGGSLGAPTLSLGWLELNGTVSNPLNYGVFYAGTTMVPPSVSLRNWRNGKEF